MSNKNLILIPGAWSDASIWKLLEREVSFLGIESQVITLEGLHQESDNKQIKLKTHIDNVISFINFQETDQFYLVGHSYSGIVASLVAERIPDKVAGLIFVEAFLPENGKSLLQVAGLDVESETKAIEHNKGRWPPPTQEELTTQPYLSNQQMNFLVDNMVDHPGKTVTDKVKIYYDTLKNIPVYYIGESLSDHIKENPNFKNIQFKKLNGGHWPMLTKPKELAGIIKEL